MRKESKGKQHMSKQRKYNPDWPSAQADSPAARAKRQAGIIIGGLQTKYGFSESSAKATMKLIKSVVLPDGSHPLEHASFATEEMRPVAFNALKFYNK